MKTRKPVVEQNAPNTARAYFVNNPPQVFVEIEPTVNSDGNFEGFSSKTTVSTVTWRY